MNVVAKRQFGVEDVDRELSGGDQSKSVALSHEFENMSQTTVVSGLACQGSFMI